MFVTVSVPWLTNLMSGTKNHGAQSMSGGRNAAQLGTRLGDEQSSAGTRAWHRRSNGALRAGAILTRFVRCGPAKESLPAHDRMIGHSPP
jgi:hypothetical protein